MPPLCTIGRSIAVLLVAACAFPHCSPEGEQMVKGDRTLSVIPRPSWTTRGTDSFQVTRTTVVVSDFAGGTAPFPPEYLATRLRSVTGFPIPLHPLGETPAENFIRFEQAQDDNLGAEGYHLDVAAGRIHIRSNTDAGALYAVQTLLQLLPPEVFGSAPSAGISWAIPGTEIRDRPRFAWRGLHVDVSRHFLPKEFIKTCIDLLVMHKMNTFHWHLTDDQGWRIEIKKYPRLTEIGAWRADRENMHWNLRTPQRSGEKPTYGGFYTQEEIREIVRYAEQRHVTIVPEIEMPAHTTAALAAYPQFSCTGGPFLVPTGALWPITDIYCAGNDSVFAFLEDILSEVMDLFPGTYIHIGGDEADKANWRTCPKCQARMKEEHLADENELQSYFIRRIERFLLSKHRRLIGWDEILEGGLAPEATVMSWRGMEGGLAAARMNHEVIMTPGAYTYFNSYQGRPEFEPPAGGGYLPLSKVYAFEPVPESLTVGQQRCVLGGQACLWTEFVADAEHAEYMLLPRLAAMAEVLWSPASLRDPEYFFGRVERQLSRYAQAGYSSARSLYQVSMTTVVDTVRREILVSLANETGTVPIHYTLDGSDPSAASAAYTAPFAVSMSRVIRAVSVRESQILGPATTHQVVIHRAVAHPVTVSLPYHKYTGGGRYALTNGLRGTLSYDDGNWQGYEGNDFEGVIDLGEVVSLERVATHFLQDTHSWIFPPKNVRFAVSEDGVTFSPAGRYDFPAPSGEKEVSIIAVALPLKNVRGRYIRVHAENLARCPSWHVGKGGKAWLFVDEIEVEEGGAR